MEERKVCKVWNLIHFSGVSREELRERAREGTDLIFA